MYPVPKEAYSYWPDQQNSLIETKDYVERLIFARQAYKDWENSAIEALDRMMDLKLPVDKEEKLRFLYGNGWNLQLTAQALAEHLKWKNDWPSIKLIYPLVSNILNSGGVYVHGRDHRYRPLIFINPAKLMDFPFQLLLATSYFLLEYIKENMLIPGQIENWVLVIDLKSFEIKEAYSKLINELQFHNPCRVCQIYLLTSQRSHPLLKLLSQNTQKKITISDSSAVLHQTVNRSQLEVKYNGHSENLSSFWPPFFPAGPYRADNDPQCGFLSGYSSYDEYFSLNNRNDLSSLKISQLEDRESFISNSEFKDEIWQKLDVVSGSFSFLHTDLYTRTADLEQEFQMKPRSGRYEDVTGTSSNVNGKKLEIEQELLDSSCCVERSCFIL